MFRITEDPSSGSLVQSLAKNDKNGSIVSVDMYRVVVMAAYCDLLCVCAVHCVGACVQFTVWVRVCSSLCGCVCAVHCVGRHCWARSSTFTCFIF